MLFTYLWAILNHIIGSLVVRNSTLLGPNPIFTPQSELFICLIIEPPCSGAGIIDNAL